MGDILYLVRCDNRAMRRGFLDRLDLKGNLRSSVMPVGRRGDLVGLCVDPDLAPSLVHEWRCYTDPDYRPWDFWWRIRHLSQSWKSGGRRDVRYRARPVRRALRSVRSGDAPYRPAS